LVTLSFFRCVLFFTATATPSVYTLSLHDALPISRMERLGGAAVRRAVAQHDAGAGELLRLGLDPRLLIVEAAAQRLAHGLRQAEDRKSTRLNSSHVSISYAVFCLKKKRTRKSRYT